MNVTVCLVLGLLAVSGVAWWFRRPIKVDALYERQHRDAQLQELEALALAEMYTTEAACQTARAAAYRKRIRRLERAQPLLLGESHS